MSARRRLAAMAVCFGALVLAGCSQFQALAPVAGDNSAAVRFAANDVLQGADVDLLAAPVCTVAADESISCTGKTVDHEPITVTSQAAASPTMTVTVGTRTLYSGSVQDVLDGAAR